jgi:DNA-binding MarR family transcriptional regulator
MTLHHPDDAFAAAMRESAAQTHAAFRAHGMIDAHGGNTRPPSRSDENGLSPEAARTLVHILCGAVNSGDLGASMGVKPSVATQRACLLRRHGLLTSVRGRNAATYTLTERGRKLARQYHAEGAE